MNKIVTTLFLLALFFAAVVHGQESTTQAPLVCQNDGVLTPGNYCSCKSGYGGGSCETPVPESCFATAAAASSPSFEASAHGSMSVAIQVNLPVVLNRGVYKFALQLASGDRYDLLDQGLIPSYERQTDAPCSETFLFDTQFSPQTFDFADNGTVTKLSSLFIVETVDAGTYTNRSITYSYPLSFSLPNQVSVSSTSRLQILSSGPLSITGGVISQVFNRQTNYYTVVYETRTNYPAYITSLSPTTLPASISLVSNSSTISVGTDVVVQRWTFSFSTEGCFFTGQYEYFADVTCHSSFPYSPCLYTTNATIIDDVVSESICASTDNNLDVTATLRAYSDNTYADSKEMFNTLDTAYFGLALSSIVSISQITLREVTAQVVTNSPAGNTSYYLIADGSNTNAFPAAEFLVSETLADSAHFAFIPSKLATFPLGEHTLTVRAVVDIQYTIGRRVTKVMELASSTGRTNIVLKQEAKQISSGSMTLPSLLLVIIAVSYLF